MRSDAQWLFEPFRLDPMNACLWRGEQMIALRPKVFAVLVYIVQHAGQLVTKEALFEAVWPETAVSDTVLKSCIREIRKTLGDTADAPRFIATVHRRGYRFIAPVLAAESPATAHVELASSPSASHAQPFSVSSAIRRASALVERETVLRQLESYLAEASRGRRQVVFVTGEPGIGKTAVVDAFSAQVGVDSRACIAWGQCVEHYGAGEAYMPVLEALGQLCRGPESARVVAVLRQHAPTWLVQMPWLLSPGDRDILQQELQGATRERMLRELSEAIDRLGAETLLVLILEDLHWSDHATLDLLAVLTRRREPARLLLLGSYRPVEVRARDHPLHALKQELEVYGLCQELSLAPLSEAAVASYLSARLPGCVIPQELTKRIYRWTDGNPLFLVNVVEHLMAREVLVESHGTWEFQRQVTEVNISVPESLQQMIAEQLDRLSPEERRVVEAGSAAGVEFTAAAVAAGLDDEVEHVEASCEHLSRRGQILRPVGLAEWPDGTVTARYAFQHALYQEVAYQRLGPSQRVHLHRRLGTRLEAGYGAQAPGAAAELARHFVQGQDAHRVLLYLRQAAETALQRHAHREAIDYLTRALELLNALPTTPEHTEQELQLYLALGGPLMATKGQASTEVEQVYARAYALCRQVEQTAQLLPVLSGLRRFYVVRGAHQMAWELGQRLLSLAERLGDRAYLLEAHRALGTTQFFRAEFPAALEHLQQAMSLYGPQRPQVSHVLGDPQVSSLIYTARALWCLGYPDQALAKSHQALALARQLAHPYSVAWSHSFIGDLHLLCGKDDVAFTLIEASLAIASEQGWPFWIARGTFFQGLLLAKQGRREEGVARMRQGIEAMWTTGAELNRPCFLVQPAEVDVHMGQTDTARALLDEAMALMDRNAERWWEAELYRVRGELLLRQAIGAD